MTTKQFSQTDLLYLYVMIC